MKNPNFLRLCKINFDLGLDIWNIFLMFRICHVFSMHPWPICSKRWSTTNLTKKNDFHLFLMKSNCWDLGTFEGLPNLDYSVFILYSRYNYSSLKINGLKWINENYPNKYTVAQWCIQKQISRSHSFRVLPETGS